MFGNVDLVNISLFQQKEKRTTKVMTINRNTHRRTTQPVKKNTRGRAALRTLRELQAEIIGITTRTVDYKNAGQHISENDPVVKKMEYIETEALETERQLIERLKKEME